jgi:uncharacterized protein YebE (UPF0316 family)
LPINSGIVIGLERRAVLSYETALSRDDHRRAAAGPRPYGGEEPVFLFGNALAAVPTLPLLIFLAELSVVTISTLRIIFVSRGMKVLAPILGFFEISIWLFAIGQIMRNLNNLSCFVAFAAGFVLGNYFGVLLEKRLAIGTVVVRLITNRDTNTLIEDLKDAGYGVTSLAGRGATGPVTVVLTVIKRKELPNALGVIEAFDPRAFYSVDEVQSAAAGIFPEEKRLGRSMLPSVLRSFRPQAKGIAPVIAEKFEHDEGTGRPVSGAQSKKELAPQ